MKEVLTLPEMEAAASDFMSTLKAGDVVYMEGDLGAGKTTFVRAAIQYLLGKDEPVPSPTFTLVQTYDICPPIWHCDFYRLDDPEEVLELGLDEAFSTGITFIEWPSKMGNVYEQQHYTVRILSAKYDEQRVLEIFKV